MTTKVDTNSTSKQAGVIGPVLGISLALWFMLILYLTLTGAFETPAGQSPLGILAAILLPQAIFLAAYLASKSFRNYVLQIDMRALILLHAWRTLGIGFLMLYTVGQLPMLFAFPAGIGDAMAAWVATFIGIAFFLNKSGVERRWIQSWNTFGLLDFVVAISIGILTREAGIAQLGGAIGSDAMTAFPLALVPGFGVPFFIITHLIVYLQLRNNWPGQQRICYA